MIYYISDLHLGHLNVLSHDSRPFSSLEEMHEVIITNWNSIVMSKDLVYVLGDFAWKQDIALDVGKQLNGTKILIEGNHDYKIRNALWQCFTDILPYADVKDNKHRVILSHYPIAHWNGQFRGAIHLYGHVHNNEDGELFNKYIEEFSTYHCTSFKAINVGCMLSYMNYTPRTLEELLLVRR